MRNYLIQGSKEVKLLYCRCNTLLINTTLFTFDQKLLKVLTWLRIDISRGCFLKSSGTISGRILHLIRRAPNMPFKYHNNNTFNSQFNTKHLNLSQVTFQPTSQQRTLFQVYYIFSLINIKKTTQVNNQPIFIVKHKKIYYQFW